MMPCSLENYRARVGMFDASPRSYKNKKKGIFTISFLYFVLLKILMALCPTQILISFAGSFIVCVFVMVIFVTLVLFYLLLLQVSLYSIFVTGNVNGRIPPIFVHFFELSLFLIVYSTVTNLLLTTFGTIERNPGPISSCNKVKFATWNVDSLLARDGSKISIIEGLDACHNFDMFGICESYLTDKIPENDLKISGFSPLPFRADSKEVLTRTRGGVCLYFKEHLPIVERTELALTDETVVAEIKLKNKKSIFHLII